MIVKSISNTRFIGKCLTINIPKNRVSLNYCKARLDNGLYTLKNRLILKYPDNEFISVNLISNKILRISDYDNVYNDLPINNTYSIFLHEPKSNYNYSKYLTQSCNLIIYRPNGFYFCYKHIILKYIKFDGEF